MKVGTAPINWNNDDLRDLRPEMPFEAVLDAMVDAGYSGTEIGYNYPDDPAVLGAALAERGLDLSGAYHWVRLADAEADRTLEIEQALGTASKLRALGARTLIVADRLTPERAAVAGRADGPDAPRLTEAGWTLLVDGLHELAARLAELGVKLAYHPHVGTYVETQQEMDTLLERTDPGLVGLCLDVGHLAYAGGDPLLAVQQHAARVRYVHLKDVDPDVLEVCRREQVGFLDALRRYVFTELGEGRAQVREVVQQLAGYDGWLVVEQDTAPGNPTETARRSREYLRHELGV